MARVAWMFHLREQNLWRCSTGLRSARRSYVCVCLLSSSCSIAPAVHVCTFACLFVCVYAYSFLCGSVVDYNRSGRRTVLTPEEQRAYEEQLQKQIAQAPPFYHLSCMGVTMAETSKVSEPIRAYRSDHRHQHRDQKIAHRCRQQLCARTVTISTDQDEK